MLLEPDHLACDSDSQHAVLVLSCEKMDWRRDVRHAVAKAGG